MAKKKGGKRPASKKNTSRAEAAARQRAEQSDYDEYEPKPKKAKAAKKVAPAKTPKPAPAAKREKDSAADKAAKKAARAEKKARRAKEADDLDTSSIQEARGISHEARRRKQFLRDLLRIGIVLFVLAALAVGLFFAYRATIVRRISVTGSSVYGEAQILSLSGVRAGKSIFFYNENTLRDDINSIPDIRVVSVKKDLPNSISVVVSDITAYAAILSPNGVYTLISDEGYVLSMGESTDHGLITIEGMTGVGFALNTYIDKQNNTIRTVGAVRLLQAIEASPIAPHVRSIDLSSSQYVTLSLDSDYSIVLGSVSTAPECIETACGAYERFLPVYPAGGTIQVFRGSSVVDFTPNK